MRDVVLAGRYGLADGPAGMTVCSRSGVQLAEIVAFRGRDRLAAQALERAYAIPLPGARRRVQAGRVSLWWSGPDRWLWESRDGDESDIEQLRAQLDGTAAVVPQTDGRRLFHVFGPRVRETLRKGFTIDLHPSAFRENDTATTAVGGMDVQIAQVDARPAYDIVVYRSFAASFWIWLEASAAEFGLEAVAA